MSLSHQIFKVTLCIGNCLKYLCYFPLLLSYSHTHTYIYYIYIYNEFAWITYSKNVKKSSSSENKLITIRILSEILVLARNHNRYTSRNQSPSYNNWRCEYIYIYLYTYKLWSSCLIACLRPCIRILDTEWLLLFIISGNFWELFFVFARKLGRIFIYPRPYLEFRFFFKYYNNIQANFLLHFNVFILLL